MRLRGAIVITSTTKQEIEKTETTVGASARSLPTAQESEEAMDK